MKWILVVLLWCSAYAIGDQNKIYFVKSKKEVFIAVPAKHLTISSSCLKKRKFDCAAFYALKTVKPQPVQDGGAHPGALICQNLKQAEVVVGTDKDGNQNSFCQFADGSLIDNGSLYYYAQKNERH
jgi:hypothetical protein